MSTFMDIYRKWVYGEEIDEETKTELYGIVDDIHEIEDRFYKDLEFGTAGLRGILGAGTNRMNKYTIGIVTQGLCDFVLSEVDGAKDKGIVIAYDPRYMSREFSEECAVIIAANGISAYLFDDIRPTPLLSFSLRYLGCAAGIVITASHNTSEYNGYKVYGDDGAQMNVSNANKVVEYTKKLTGYGDIRRISKDEAIRSGLLKVIGKELDDEYIRKIHTLSLRGDEIRSSLKDFRMIYTPLHGTGNIPVRRILSEMGYTNVIVVPEQEKPDPRFPTVESPNPEYRSAFDLAIELAKKEDVDIIIGTDPDCDRIGVVYKDNHGEYLSLTGNQIGCLLMDYILSSLVETNKLPERPFVVKSIVSSKMADIIAKNYGVEIYGVFTGFKNVCKLVRELDEFGNKHFIYGFEEANGYVAGTFVRDKDGVIASLLVAEMAAYYRTKGMSIADVIDMVNARYGHTLDEVVSYTLTGKEGLEKISETMVRLRDGRPLAFGVMKINVTKDYQTDEIIDLKDGTCTKINSEEKSNVLFYEMEDGSSCIIRPSGTEPKIKLYFSVTGPGAIEAQSMMASFKACVTEVIEDMLGV